MQVDDGNFPLFHLFAHRRPRKGSHSDVVVGTLTLSGPYRLAVGWPVEVVTTILARCQSLTDVFPAADDLAHCVAGVDDRAEV